MLETTVPWEKLTPQPVVVIGHDPQCSLSEVLTPARQQIPSPGHPVTAQTAAWVADASLKPGHSVPQQIRIDLKTETLSIVETTSGKVTGSWPVVTGNVTDTPTPAVTSYVEDVYVDPTQAETQGLPIALTGAHSPLMPSFSGNSAELAVHFMDSAPGASSHGCIRLASEAGARAVAALGTGTPITVTEN